MGFPWENMGLFSRFCLFDELFLQYVLEFLCGVEFRHSTASRIQWQIGNGMMRGKCLSTRFLGSRTLLCAGYSVKLKNIFLYFAYSRVGRGEFYLHISKILY